MPVDIARFLPETVAAVRERIDSNPVHLASIPVTPSFARHLRQSQRTPFIRTPLTEEQLLAMEVPSVGETEILYLRYPLGRGQKITPSPTFGPGVTVEELIRWELPQVIGISWKLPTASEVLWILRHHKSRKESFLLRDELTFTSDKPILYQYPSLQQGRQPDRGYVRLAIGNQDKRGIDVIAISPMHQPKNMAVFVVGVPSRVISQVDQRENRPSDTSQYPRVLDLLDKGAVKPADKNRGKEWEAGDKFREIPSSDFRL